MGIGRDVTVHLLPSSQRSGDEEEEEEEDPLARFLFLQLVPRDSGRDSREELLGGKTRKEDLALGGQSPRSEFNYDFFFFFFFLLISWQSCVWN